MSTDRYVSPLSERYASKEMQYVFSPDKKFRTWRRLWIALAETEKDLGLPITDEQIGELKEHKDDINYDVAREREKVVRHDVMSHVYAYGQQCPKAKGIIHLGATSCYVGDNTDIIIMAEALEIVRKKLLNVIAELAAFADEYKALPTLAFTHFQPAQPTTVGKRATLWMQEFMMDLEDLEYVKDSLKLLGSKGTTGTQASFLELFEGDQEKIDRIDPMIAEKMGFKACYPVSGQTYSRKVDTRVVNVLAGIAASAHKFSNDIRLLQHLKEVEEPFEKTQIGSSAMAYKRNPMRSERIASLSRYVMADALNPAITSAAQWFERTLDDSANKRLSVPEGFLAVDGILDLCLNVVDGLVVYPKVIEKRLMSELPFMATENIMMDAVKAGGDRQELHEKIRELSMEAGRNVKEKGLDNNLLELIAADPAFNLSEEELKKTMDPSRYTGRAAVQVDAFLKDSVSPLLEANKEVLGMSAEINV
ncbi:adenylosuccinate lyase [Clostridium sp. AF15-17LB]|uniref:adenylosuccinate lyase n=1 Tax=Extibacter sp. GGCC_0201 TaxID=2731209 RepID=UPI000E511C77|nr:adenylosuccinate lyase [Extibacter sp. GGCC_0201]MBO1721332.1 adenylosuccinate lyase [Extibacter sp. GGCC_0201]RGU90707.1 adenylosuccinate lyase [Clostridium sp. AF15-17LB]